ncbi:MAG: DUF433 domain-containing protein [Chloroflexota bacterium]
MIHTPAAVAVPLRTDENGVIRIGDTRVTLVTVIGRHRAGDTAEQIHEGFPAVPLTDIYAVIAYYLANRDAVDDYLREVDEAAAQTRREWKARYTPEQTARNEYLNQQIASNQENN